MLLISLPSTKSEHPALLLIALACWLAVLVAIPVPSAVAQTDDAEAGYPKSDTSQSAADSNKSLNDMDRMTIRDTIQSQLDAFAADDEARAFALASPGIQAKAGNAAKFMAMVRANYQPVYRPRAVFFQDVTMMDGAPAQRVLVMDAKGAPVQAIYPMQRQDDGSWRINGCMLYRGKARML
jgi:hypothetical protein